MPRKMKSAPENILLARTSRGSWIALEEVWDGDVLVELRPMRGTTGEGILQARERREMLAEVERAALHELHGRVRQLERKLNELSGPEARALPAARYAATG